MTTILGLSGSLRRGSYNTALLRAARELAPDGVELEIGSIAGIPLYDGDLESEQGLPAAVTELKEKIVAADGLLLVTPEYNNSLPGVFKNAIDWLSRPPKDIPRVFGNKPVALIGATPGAGGTRFSQTAWLPVLRTLGVHAWFGKQLYVAHAGQVFDAEGKLVDEKVRKHLGDLVAGFAAFVRS
ncbi:MAG: NADPH-dependent FMN reductase [Myxococcales bacterium 68-20]|nr:NAD(P)H-dependent oxidoreductase [Myxococcales bacterium]OJY31404.1 MAG: NADPH-dependent FMN reductase [Myxococcales bacterium 68-20]